ncbi:hypothetical protein GOP47_0026440 [Adiantum capillus-veneris]|nr:hypothetical protein GOP47_0026440 [Adiantum capillus-veneris]
MWVTNLYKGLQHQVNMRRRSLEVGTHLFASYIIIFRLSHPCLYTISSGELLALGNPQKRMEREAGAKIVIKGEGSAKKGKLLQKWDMRKDPRGNEELHVLIEADNAVSLEKAAGMIKNLLVPIDVVVNQRKRAQRRELAALNGTIRDDEIFRLCGEPDYRQYSCSARNSIFKSHATCKISDCQMKTSCCNNMYNKYKKLFAALGGGVDSTNRPGANNAR